jgi:hypothetical protein
MVSLESVGVSSFKVIRQPKAAQCRVKLPNCCVESFDPQKYSVITKTDAIASLDTGLRHKQVWGSRTSQIQCYRLNRDCQSGFLPPVRSALNGK